MRSFLFLISILTSIICSSCASISTKNSFVKIYKSINVRSYDLSLEKNTRYFIDFIKQPELEAKLAKLEIASKNCDDNEECTLFSYELRRLKNRVALAKKLVANDITSLEDLKKNKVLYRKSYEIALNEWTNDLNFSVKEITSFEKNEISRIRHEIKEINVEKKTKVTSPKVIEDYLNQVKNKVSKNISKVFTRAQVDEIKIKRNMNPKSQNIPGYYDSSSGTFFYSLPKRGIYLGDLDWLYLHEALPGHHLQIQLNKGSKASILFSRDYIYLDFIEGWAAYVEIYGRSLGIYNSKSAKRKALEWDLLRSTRVIIDIGLHLKGWSDEKAKDKWKKLAPEVLELADREIARMRKWPAQVISYEYGKMKFIKARDNYLRSNKGSLLNFHEYILSRGQVPTSLL
jgi:uncharacterized protein (DUF885 family)